MKIKYTGTAEVEVPALGLRVKPGGVVDVPKADADSLVEQGSWVPVVVKLTGEAGPELSRPKTKTKDGE